MSLRGQGPEATFVNRALAGFGAIRAPGRDPPGTLPFVGGQSGPRPLPAQPGCFYQDSALTGCLQASILLCVSSVPLWLGLVGAVHM